MTTYGELFKATPEEKREIVRAEPAESPLSNSLKRLPSMKGKTEDEVIDMIIKDIEQRGWISQNRWLTDVMFNEEPEGLIVSKGPEADLASTCVAMMISSGTLNMFTAKMVSFELMLMFAYGAAAQRDGLIDIKTPEKTPEEVAAWHEKAEARVKAERRAGGTGGSSMGGLFDLLTALFDDDDEDDADGGTPEPTPA